MIVTRLRTGTEPGLQAVWCFFFGYRASRYLSPVLLPIRSANGEEIVNPLARKAAQDRPTAC